MSEPDEPEDTDSDFYDEGEWEKEREELDEEIFLRDLHDELRPHFTN